jgi:hypothetical protein
LIVHAANPQTRLTSLESAASECTASSASLSRSLGDILKAVSTVPDQERTPLLQGELPVLRELATLLATKHAPVVVFGDVSAGKSAFLNTVLGANVLPSSNGACTRAVCEIFYADKPCLFTFQTPSIGSRDVASWFLNNSGGVKRKVKDFKDGKEMAKYLADRAFHRVRIGWPAPILKVGPRFRALSPFRGAVFDRLARRAVRRSLICPAATSLRRSRPTSLTSSRITR